jgi:hypothetical protein
MGAQIEHRSIGATDNLFYSLVKEPAIRAFKASQY